MMSGPKLAFRFSNITNIWAKIKTYYTFFILDKWMKKYYLLIIYSIVEQKESLVFYGIEC